MPRPFWFRHLYKQVCVIRDVYVNVSLKIVVWQLYRGCPKTIFL